MDDSEDKVMDNHCKIMANTARQKVLSEMLLTLAAGESELYRTVNRNMFTGAERTALRNHLMDLLDLFAPEKAG